MVAVLAALLAVGPGGGRLSVRLMEQGLICGGMTHCIDLGGVHTLVLGLVAARGVCLERLERVLEAELESLTSESEGMGEEIDLARRRAYREAAVQIDRWESRAERLAQGALQGQDASPFALDRFSQVSMAEVTDLMRREMSPERRVWLVLRPKGEDR
jgi:predicted Zn-dependent peptidase